MSRIMLLEKISREADELARQYNRLRIQASGISGMN
jgi:hypothetical protein